MYTNRTSPLKVGDLVYHWTKRQVPGKPDKITNRWTGLFVVTEVLNNICVKIDSIHQPGRPVLTTIHHLQKYTGPNTNHYDNPRPDLDPGYPPEDEIENFLGSVEVPRPMGMGTQPQQPSGRPVTRSSTRVQPPPPLPSDLADLPPENASEDEDDDSESDSDGEDGNQPREPLNKSSNPLISSWENTPAGSDTEDDQRQEEESDSDTSQGNNTVRRAHDSTLKADPAGGTRSPTATDPPANLLDNIGDLNLPGVHSSPDRQALPQQSSTPAHPSQQSASDSTLSSPHRSGLDPTREESEDRSPSGSRTPSSGQDSESPPPSLPDPELPPPGNPADTDPSSSQESPPDTANDEIMAEQAQQNEVALAELARRTSSGRQVHTPSRFQANGSQKKKK